ncbi:hypothetical protein [Chryseobacterium indologenes]|uniref:hypothetical protein n=1 Tax=Chryseobacterium indologenes TaxID=253 RepID=UPI00162318F0|nr:hypothetical protein [Chryseobacterium indologenes]
MSTNVNHLNPIHQIKVQKMSVDIDLGSENYLEDDITLFPDEEISLDVNVKLKSEFHPDCGMTVKSFKLNYTSGYNQRECEELDLTPHEIRDIENYLQNHLVINLS